MCSACCMFVFLYKFLLPLGLLCIVSFCGWLYVCVVSCLGHQRSFLFGWPRNDLVLSAQKKKNDRVKFQSCSRSSSSSIGWWAVLLCVHTRFCASSKVESFFLCQSRTPHHNLLMFRHTLQMFGWTKEFCIFLISLKILIRVTSFECEWMTKKKQQL